MQVMVDAARDQLGSFAPLTTTGSTPRAAAGWARAPSGTATTSASVRAGRTSGQWRDVDMWAPLRIAIATLAPGAKGESMLTTPIPGFGRPTHDFRCDDMRHSGLRHALARW